MYLKMNFNLEFKLLDTKVVDIITISHGNNLNLIPSLSVYVILLIPNLNI